MQVGVLFCAIALFYSVPSFSITLENIVKHQNDEFNALNIFCDKRCSNCQFSSSYCRHILYAALGKMCEPEKKENCFFLWTQLSEECEKKCPML